jgi:uroporphyrinogen-III synthase
VISAAAAQGVGSGWEAVETAAQPSDEALLALAARLCDRSSPQ